MKRGIGEISSDTQEFSSLVAKMLQIQDFLALTMSKNNTLTDFFYCHPKSEKKILKISKYIQEILPDSEDDDNYNNNKFTLRDEYILAFNNMENSKGYSMLKFLKNNPDLGDYLRLNINKVNKIYIRFLKDEIKQIDAQIDLVDDKINALENNHAQKRPKLCVS